MSIKKTAGYALLSLLMVALSTVSGLSAVPMLINYQGHLTDSSGTPISGSQWVDFSLFRNETGGTSFWNEQQTVEVTNGIFNVQLGAGNPLEADDFNTPDVYLEVTIHISGQVWETLSPRHRLTSTAFSVKAGNADSLEGKTLIDLDARYINENTDVISIPAPAFLPKDNSIRYDTNGVRLVVPDAGDNTFMAPVFLPTNSRVTNIILEARDNSGGASGGHIKIVFSQIRYNTVLDIVNLDTGIASAPGETRIASSTYDHLINNSEFGYVISLVINNGNGGAWNQLFYKVIIHYTVH